MTERIITGCDAVHPDRRGGQHVAKRCAGVLVIDDDRGVGVLINSERSQHANLEHARRVLAGLVPSLLVLGHNLMTAGALEQARQRGQAEAVIVIAAKRMERSEREANGLVVLACPTCERGPLVLDSTCERCCGTGAWLVEVRPLLANLYAASALAYADKRVGSGRYCRVCDEPTTRESWEHTVDGCPACWRRA